jgi:hypothetical protein
MIKEKIEKILELLKIKDDDKKTAGQLLFRMHRSLKDNDLKLYAENESILFGIMGLDIILEKKLLNESDVQNLHDKIKFMIELKNIESHKLFEQYFTTKQASRDIDKISKDNFKWDSLSENTVPEKRKMIVKTYDSESMEFEGKPVTAELIQSMFEKGIILMSSHNKKSLDMKQVNTKMDMK